MKKIAKMSLWLLGLGLFLGACENDGISPSGDVTIQGRNVTDFDGLDVSTAIEVDVEFTSGEEKVEIETDDNLQSRILVDKSGSILRIRIANGTNISGNATLKAHILTPTPMNFLAASGASSITLRNQLETEELQVSMSGASYLSGEVITSYLEAGLSGAAHITLEGSATDFMGEVEGASSIKGFSMICSDLDLELSGASNANLTVNGTIDLDASGSSVLVFKGNPTIGWINLSGSSELVNGN